MTKPIRWSGLLASALICFAVQSNQADADAGQVNAAPAAATPTSWPSRLIKATIPFGAGSATDVVPRLVFEHLAVELGQPIVVENRTGAGGTLGAATVVRADPDGYSILAHSSALT